MGRLRPPLGLAVAAFFATGIACCTHLTEPVQMGPDTYMIGLGSNGGFSSDADLMAETVKAAGTFCESKGKRVEVQSTKEHGTQGWTPQSNQVVFKCQ